MFIHTWKDSFKEYTDDVARFNNVSLSQPRDEAFFRRMVGCGSNVSFDQMLRLFSSALSFISNTRHMTDAQYAKASKVWQDISYGGGNLEELFQMWQTLENHDDGIQKSVVDFHKFLEAAHSVKSQYDWLLSEGVAKAIKDCVYIDSVVTNALTDTICHGGWSHEGTRLFHNGDSAIECNYAERSLFFPNFKEFLRFKYNMSKICGKQSYKFCFEDICSEVQYGGDIAIGDSFDDFLYRFLHFVGAGEKNLWNDGSGSYALFFGNDEVGNLYNQEPDSGIVHYRIYVPFPCEFPVDDAPICKLGVFSNREDDGRTPVQVFPL